MLKPKAIIYSRNLYRTLRGSLGTKEKTSIGRKTIRVVHEKLDFELHRREVGPNEDWMGSAQKLRELPEVNHPSVTLEKIDLGDGVHLADPGAAYGMDLRRYEVIILDLDFELVGDAAARVGELVLGLTEDASYKAPRLWSDIAASASHTIVFIQAKSYQMSERIGVNAALPRLHALLAGLNLPQPQVRENYDLFPVKTIALDPTHNVGRELLGRHRVVAPLAGRAEKTLTRWIEKSTAFRWIDDGTERKALPTGMSYVPLVRLTSQEHELTVAAACQVGKSLVALLPRAELEPLDWVDSVIDIGETALLPKLFTGIVETVPLSQVRLLARRSDPGKKEKDDKTIIKLDWNGKLIEVMINRDKDGRRHLYHFNSEYLDLLKYLHASGMEKAEMAANLDDLPGQLSHLRNAIEAALKQVPMPSADAKTQALKIIPLNARKTGAIEAHIEFV